jgi:hypothetical protein
MKWYCLARLGWRLTVRRASPSEQGLEDVLLFLCVYEFVGFAGGSLA